VARDPTRGQSAERDTIAEAAEQHAPAPGEHRKPGGDGGDEREQDGRRR
jgi:hypothetical protein